MTAYTASGPAVPSTELVKGDEVQLYNGWTAHIEDNRKRSTTRLMTVRGFVTEMGEVYAHEIAAVRRNDQWSPVQCTPAQLRLRNAVIRF